jgi:hypothetical protein
MSCSSGRDGSLAHYLSSADERPASGRYIQLALRNLRERKTGLYGPNVENSGRSETSARGSDLRADSNGV